MDVKDRIVVVTGASSGIGRATARAVAARGGRVALLARSEDKLQEIAGEISRHGGSARYYAVDLSDAEAVTRVAAAIRTDLGVPDILINNAGLGRWLYIKDTLPAEAMQMIASPYLAAFYPTRAFLPAMLDRGSGHVACVTSVGSYMVWPGAGAYIAARFALRGFTEALRAEVRGTGIGVTLVVLGKVASPYWAHNPGSEEHVPRALPVFMPTLSTEQAATTILRGIERNMHRVIRPSIFRFLFLLSG